jgi:hypothetical protein
MLSIYEMRIKASQARREKSLVKKTTQGIDSSELEFEGKDVDIGDIGEATPLEEEEFAAGEAKMEPFNLRAELDDGTINISKGEIHVNKRQKLNDKEEYWLLEHDKKVKDKTFTPSWPISDNNKEETEAIALKPEEKMELVKKIIKQLYWGESVATSIKRLRSDENSGTYLNDINMVSMFKSDIYSSTKEDLLDYVEKDGVAQKVWYYKWGNLPSSEADVKEGVYGPFSTEAMQQWSSEGYFVPRENGAKLLVQQLPSDEETNDKNWVAIDTIDFSVL